MHKHNLDLIAEFAQGALADPSRARALVESCDTCHAEYEMQISMMATLLATGSATLSDHERSALHRDIWTELRNPVATRTGRGAAWWSAWVLGGATVVFAVVGLSGVLGNDNQVVESFSEIGSALEGDTAPLAVSPTADEDEGAVAETTSTEASESLTRSLENDAAYKAVADDVRARDDASLYAYEGADEEKARLEHSECLIEAGLGDFSAVTGFEDLTDLIIAIPPTAAAEPFSVAFVDPTNCSVVHLEE